MKPLFSNPILVTGSHRSGTTWVGKMIALSEKVYYIHEPLAPNGLLCQKHLIPYWYIYLDNPQMQYKYHLSRILTFNYTLPEAVYPRDEKKKFYYKKIPEKCQQLLRQYRFKKRRKQITIRPLLKDPFAIFSVEWLYNTLRTKNIILIRHPAAFVGSVKRMNWRFDFRNFRQQKKLMDRFLSPYESLLNNPPQDHISEAALLWVCIHHAIHQYQQQYPEWMILKHETISQDPIKIFQPIYQYLELPFTTKTRNTINTYSSSNNPIEVEKKGQVHQLKRDSRANIKTWKNRLTPEEIQKVRSITEPIARHFYSDEDW